MKPRTTLTAGLLFCIALGVLSFAFAGCKSKPKVDWNSRVGNYTYDQAVVEMGPPDKSEKLSDGKTVAEWIRRSRGGGLSLGLGTGSYGGGTAVGGGVGTTIRSDDKILRLTFGADGKLLSWSRNY